MVDGVVVHHIHGVIEERAGVLYRDSTTDNDHNCWGLAPHVHLSAFGQRLANI